MQKKNRKWKFLIFTCLFHTLDECKNNESQTDSAVALLPTLHWNVETHTKKLNNAALNNLGVRVCTHDVYEA